jgi:hypothetical protein
MGSYRKGTAIPHIRRRSREESNMATAAAAKATAPRMKKFWAGALDRLKKLVES